ncbi:DUF3320 domain-containing protein [Halomonas ramblicola]|uniref:DUF3320 domain-containing protein n=1 Tax=Halomonas ramblicola TaxID=747349 RepID=UPI0025B2F664|nr:DUF3320 domain-containing protein [Halomonas ramblicola]MDN3523317.1 DUF3320 domain-containing protein [Halomonas ramblicola]
MSSYDDETMHTSDLDLDEGDIINVEPKCEIRAQIARRVTFATHQCDIPVIADLVLSNPFDHALEDLTLHLTCEPKILGDRTWTIDRIVPESELRPRDRRVTVSGGMLDNLTERTRGEIHLELRQNDQVLAESHHRIDALARNEWGGSQYMPELLAAFVMPNDTAVQRVLKEAATILEGSGKCGSLEGYQSKSRKRSWEILSGIWAAVSSRNITYADPPASFERNGQKIRFPSMIEEHGLATCLDTALLFAAAIEQAGLYPVVVFTEGHAVTGAWLQPQSLPSLTVEDPMEIRKAIAQEELVLFETTMATTGQPLPFSRAIAEGRRQVAEENEDNFIYAIDIRQARGRDIQPLSSLVGFSIGTATEETAPVRAAPPLDEAPDLPPFEAAIVEDDIANATPEERLDRWKRSLLDLSKRNRLLNLKTSNTAIPIFCPDPAHLEDKVAEGKKIKIITPPEQSQGSDQSDKDLYQLRTGEDFAEKFAEEALARNEIVANVDARSLEKGAIELYRKAKADFEEGGSNTLFLALGMLRWSPTGDSKRTFRAPLILLPVKIDRASAASRPYLSRHEDEPVFNLTLLQMLRQDFNIDIPSLDGELVADESGVDVRRVWDQVRAKIREVSGFEVVEEVVLSTFSFAKYLMWKDLSDRTDALKAAPFVQHVIDHPREPYQNGASFIEPREIDKKVDPAEVLAPLNADASQIVAIHASGGEGDFVLEGPPGTGKSETIANIIAHNLGLGRRVLFVSEKMAALDVVYRRLNACGLGDFCLELHSAKANKRAVLSQLGAAWENRGIRSAEEWQQKLAKLGEIRAELNGLVKALHHPGPGGMSPRDAIGRAMRHGDVHRLRLNWERDSQGAGYASTPEALAHLEEIAKRLGQQFEQLQPEDIETFSEIAHTDWSYAWAEKIVVEARALGIAITDLKSRRKALADKLGIEDAGEDPSESAALAAVAAMVPDCARQDLGFALTADGREVLETLDTLAESLDSYAGDRERLSAPYPDEKIPGKPFDSWAIRVDKIDGKPWPLSAMARRKLRKELREAFSLDTRQVTEPEEDIPVLSNLSRLRGEMEQTARSLPSGTPWNGLDTDPERLRHAIDAGRHLRESVAKLASFGRDYVETRTVLARVLCQGRDMLEPGMPIASSADELVSAQNEFDTQLKAYRAVSSDGIEFGPVDLDILAKNSTAIVERERRLNTWCQWIAISREARQAGLDTLVTALKSGIVDPSQTVEVLRTAYACWLAPILIDARPELRRFSSVRHDDLIRTFRELDKEVAELTSSYIRAKLSGGVPKRDAGGADPGYGVLSRELQKKMRHKPVRQLVSEMGDALTSLTPCLMMSPLSVAQFLPAEKAFDLVVFDEASQITVPDAVGAIARGKRCIVVGDPKQMPPTNFFSRGAEDSDNEEARDLESILDEALAARMPHHRLTGHYRSRHESLITFSNHAYYGSQLVTFPSADTAESAVSFRRVDGVYAKGKARTNEVEARGVVEEIITRLCDPARNHLSVGVVTLNSEQQRLIEDLLDHERRADPDLEPFFDPNREDPVFVKNLETVQGDQRDVILLSVGYGPSEPGARTMSMNFGPLNKQGGERRLNVAITRATTEVMIFASFDASMIDLTRTSSEAVKDLKHYIDFAARGPMAIGEAIHSTGGDHAYDSDFEMAVAERLRSYGWSVRTQIGISKFRVDLGIVHPEEPGKFLAGVECDGATYHSSPTARDRDRVRQLILENLGWKIFRIWSTDFFQDPNTSASSLNDKLADLLKADRERVAAEAELQAEDERRRSEGESENQADTSEVKADDDDYPTEPKREAIEPTTPSLDDSINSETPPRFAQGPIVKEKAAGVSTEGSNNEIDPEQFHEPSYQPRVQALALDIIDREGPVTFKRIGDHIARMHGFQRTGRQIRQTIWRAVHKHREHFKTPDDHTVFWPHGATPQNVMAFRGFDIGHGIREWREVPYPEKLGLVRDVLHGSDKDEDVARQVARRLDVGRLTAQLRSEINDLVEHLEHP